MSKYTHEMLRAEQAMTMGYKYLNEQETMGLLKEYDRLTAELAEVKAERDALKEVADSFAALYERDEMIIEGDIIDRKDCGESCDNRECIINGCVKARHTIEMYLCGSNPPRPGQQSEEDAAD